MFLLIAGDNHYPSDGTEDWVGVYKTKADALSKVSTMEHKREISRGKKAGTQVTQYVSYIIIDNNDRVLECDWYEIVDLNEVITQGVF
jgi:hypothetical protein